jgi:2-methylcitrate dehydratase PrpD
VGDSISRTFAKWADGLTYDDLPPTVVDKVKGLVLVHLAAAVLGAPLARAREVVAVAKAEEGRPDGATILVDGAKATRAGATMANCEVIHAAQLVDSYRMITHPGPGLIAAALVNGELENRDGRQVLAALAAGYEFQCRLAKDFVPSVAARGFRPSPIFSTMGTALTAAKLLGLGEDGFVAAIAIAASSASGLFESGHSGGGESALHELTAARQGVFSALMAKTCGLTGSERSIEGDAGLLYAYAGSRDGRLSYVFTGPRQIDLATVTDGLGTRYNLLDVMVRWYPVAGFIQPVIDLAVELIGQNDIAVDDIAQIVVEMNYIETLYPSPEFPRPPDAGRPARGSTAYCVAHAAFYGGYPVVGGEVFGDVDRVGETDPEFVRFMVENVRIVGVHGQPMFSPSITIHLHDGRAFSGSYPYARMALNFDEVVEGLGRCVPRMRGGGGRLERLVDTVSRFAELDSMDPIFQAVGRGD